MFEGITSSLTGALSFFRGSGKLTEASIREGLKAVRQALLEADVNYDVAQEFVDKITDEAIGQKVLESLSPQEMILGIVYQELINLMGPVDHELKLRRDGLSIIMLCGLQGSGKTTTAGKLARMLKEQGNARLPSNSSRRSAPNWKFRCMPKLLTATRLPCVRTA